MIKYLKLDPKPSDLTIIRVIKARTGYRCKDIWRIVVSKWKTKLTGIAGFLRTYISGSLNNIIVGIELWSQANYDLCQFVYIGGSWRFYQWGFALKRAIIIFKLSDIVR